MRYAGEGLELSIGPFRDFLQHSGECLLLHPWVGRYGAALIGLISIDPIRSSEVVDMSVSPWHLHPQCFWQM